MMPEEIAAIEPALPMPDSTRAVIGDQWLALARPGTWWTGRQRVAIAAAARSARRGAPATDDGSIDPVTVRAAERVAADAGHITADAVDGFIADGLEPLAYVELVGIIARTTAIDTAIAGLDADLPPLPVPKPGLPNRAVPDGVKKRSAWVPMVGAAGAVTALSGVVAEAEAQEELHAELYLSYDQMGDTAIVKGLTRTQMELVAAHTSFVNECFY